MLLMGNSTISMAIFNSYVKLPEGTPNSWLDGLFHGQFHEIMDHEMG